ncbi:hypothetical protein [Olleya marilimosa]|uniref:Lipoprotein n=1 Tax=Olleya marilimosa TaxID=272164 RepID=A0ABR8LTZ9_9FLAO|nr:hypothetical protein [Olleya marilimosa]MBD3863171.1 hypothetical protein [Olleya marilimosa]
MKKTKSNLVMLLAILFTSYFFQSCESEEITSKESLKSEIENQQDFTNQRNGSNDKIYLGDFIYQVNNNILQKNNKDLTLEYNLDVDYNNRSLSYEEVAIGNNETGLLIKLDQSDDTILLRKNNSLSNNKVEFNALASNGVLIENIIIESEEFVGLSNKWCWKCISIVLGALVDAVVYSFAVDLNSNCELAIKLCKESGGVANVTLSTTGGLLGSSQSCKVECVLP